MRVGKRKDADQIVGVTLEDPCIRIAYAARLDHEIGLALELAPPPLQAAHEAVQHRGRLRLAFLQRRADDGRQITDLLRHEEIMLHEAFDARKRAGRMVVHALRQDALHLEGQTLLGPARHEMQVAAHPPQEFLAAVEFVEFVPRQQAGHDQFIDVAHVIDVFGDPEERVEVAQPALSLLDVRLDEVARGAGLPDALVALLELGMGEIRAGSAHDLPIEATAERIEGRDVAADEPRFEQGRADRHVFACARHALADRARRMADLQPRIPEHVEHRLRQADRRRRFGRVEDEQIDIRAGGERSAAVAAHRADGDAVATPQPGQAAVTGQNAVEGFEDHVLGLAEITGSRHAAMRRQQVFGNATCLLQERLGSVDDLGPARTGLGRCGPRQSRRLHGVLTVPIEAEGRRNGCSHALAPHGTGRLRAERSAAVRVRVNDRHRCQALGPGFCLAPGVCLGSGVCFRRSPRRSRQCPGRRSARLP